MDDPEHRIDRTVLDPSLSPAAVERWAPFIHEVTRACLNEKIEDGSMTSSTTWPTSCPPC